MTRVEASFGRLSLALLFCLIVVSRATRGDSLPSDNSARYIGRTFLKPTPDAKNSRWPVLTIDGGGLRGIVVSEILIELESAMKRTLIEIPDVREPATKFTSPNEFEIDLADYFNAIAGVSTGSWIACYLASKGGNGASKRVFESRTIIKKYGQIRAGSVEGLRVLFIHYADQIYPKYSVRFTWAPKLWRPFDFYYAGFNRPRYPVRQLETVLDLFLGQTSFLETSNTTLMVLTYDLIRKAAVFFISDHIKEKDPTTRTFVLQNEKEPRSTRSYSYTSLSIEGKNFYMKDIARASSAAPTVYEAKRFTAVNDESFELCAVDGGLMSNNPTLMTTYYLLENLPYDASNPVTDKITILSIGVGIPTGRYRKHSDSGSYQWFIETNDFLSIMMDGGSEYIQTLFASLYYNRGMSTKDKRPEGYSYLRIQLAFDTLTQEGDVLADMYDFRVAKKMQDVGKQIVERYKDRIAKFADKSLVTMIDKPSDAEFESAFLLQFPQIPTGTEKEPEESLASKSPEPKTPITFPELSITSPELSITTSPELSTPPVIGNS